MSCMDSMFDKITQSIQLEFKYNSDATNCVRVICVEIEHSAVDGWLRRALCGKGVKTRFSTEGMRDGTILGRRQTPSPVLASVRHKGQTGSAGPGELGEGDILGQQQQQQQQDGAKEDNHWEKQRGRQTFTYTAAGTSGAAASVSPGSQSSLAFLLPVLVFLFHLPPLFLSLPPLFLSLPPSLRLFRVSPAAVGAPLPAPPRPRPRPRARGMQGREENGVISVTCGYGDGGQSGD
ncbi:uncharacterized protein [Penaeus vannamei]|uniref:uncharacterized protein n=1 Tax=Penaeus vannamei TaxID=6689 RepID=UPI00387F6055